MTRPPMFSRTAPAPAPPFLRQPVFGLSFLIAAAIGIRATMLFGSPLVPGMNGAYYLVQARSLLEHGQLGIPDLPLTFWLHAALAKLIQVLSGLPSDDAIVWAVKLADATLPPLVAVPVAWMARRWSGSSSGNSSALVWLVPAAVVCLGAQALRMTGDFQKNSLALVWLAALAPAAFAFLREPSVRTLAVPLGVLALLGLTHIGVLGAALVFSAALAVVAWVRAEPGQKRHILALTLSGAGVLTLAGAITFTLYDPARVSRLAGAFASPFSFAEEREPGHRGSGRPPHEAFADGDAMPARPDFAGADMPAGNWPTLSGSDTQAGTPDETPARDRLAPGGRTRPAGRGAPGVLLDPRTALPMATCLLVGCASLWIVWRQRRELPAAEATIVAAAAITGTLLALPVFDAQKAERLVLIAVVPAAIAGSFVLSRCATKTWVHWIGAISTLTLLAGAARALPMGHRSTVSENTIAELRSIAPLIEKPEQTLIVARHGLEWWTAWTLHTHIAQPMAVSDSDWTTYTQVLYLQEKRQEAPPDMPGTAANPRPPPGAMAGTPPFRPGDGGMELPSDATTLHDGDNLTLAHVTEMPRRGPPRIGWK